MWLISIFRVFFFNWVKQITAVTWMKTTKAVTEHLVKTQGWETCRRRRTSDLISPPAEGKYSPDATVSKALTPQSRKTLLQAVVAFDWHGGGCCAFESNKMNQKHFKNSNKFLLFTGFGAVAEVLLRHQTPEHLQTMVRNSRWVYLISEWGENGISVPFLVAHGAGFGTFLKVLICGFSCTTVCGDGPKTIKSSRTEMQRVPTERRR